MNPIRSLCVFSHHGSRYALDVALVGEVLDTGNITPLPRCPLAVLGLVSLRGRPLAVVDSARLLDLPAHLDGPGGRLLVIRTPARLAGLTVDHCDGVLAADPARFSAANRLIEPPWVAGFQRFPGLPTATVINGPELVARLDHLRFSTASTAFT